MKRFWWMFLLPLALIPLFFLRPAVMTVGNYRLDNTRFAYYYWSEFFYFKEAYSEYLSGSVDFSKPLDEQMYGDSITWEDHLIGESLSVAADTLIVVQAAQQAGFVLPADYEQALKETWNGFLAQSGGDMKSYLQDSYGKGADAGSFYTYLEHCHLAAAYADVLYAALNPTDAQVADWLDDHMGEYLDAGLTDPDDQLKQARQDLTDRLYQQSLQQLREGVRLRIHSRAIRIRAPKGLYE